MPYEQLTLPSFSDRPFFYTNFVQTVDGISWVNHNGREYWPIGSALDYQTLIRLRSYADVLIHGKNTATWIRTIDNLGKPDFQVMRKAASKTKPILYVLLTAHPSASLLPFLENPPAGVECLLVTTETANVPAQLGQQAPIVRLGKKTVDIALLSAYLHGQGHKQVLMEGGSHALASFMTAGYLDELFITIAPKIFGNEAAATYGLVEGHLFSPQDIKQLHLLSVEQVADELYLRYQVTPPHAG